MHVLNEEYTSQTTGSTIPASGASEITARLDEAGIDSAVVAAFGRPMPDDVALLAANNYVSGEVGSNPGRLTGLCTINPAFLSAQGEVDRCLEQPGMVGVALNLDSTDTDMTDPEDVADVAAIFDRAQQHGAPVLFDAGSALSAEGLNNLIDILEDHQDVRVLHANCASMVDGRSIDAWLAAFDSGRVNPENSFVALDECVDRYQDSAIISATIAFGLREWGLDRVLFASNYAEGVQGRETPQEALDALSMFPFTQEEVDQITSNDASAWLGQ